MIDIGVDTAHLMGLFAGLLLHGEQTPSYLSESQLMNRASSGCYMAVFGVTMYILRLKKAISRVIVYALIVLFCLSTANMGGFSSAFI